MPASKSTFLPDFLNLPVQRASAVRNMAMDAALLDFAAASGLPAIRFYQWSEPAMTFGYSQRWSAVCQTMASFPGPCLRRLTGGGIVDHRTGHTYAFALPQSISAGRLPAPEIYRAVHQALVETLAAFQITSTLAPCPRACQNRPPAPAESPPPPISPDTNVAKACFTAPEADDVILPDSARKLAGAAMKRTRDGLLLQGSLLGPEIAAIPPEALANAFTPRLAAWLNHSPRSLDSSPLDSARIGHWHSRFDDPAWNQRR